MQVILAMTTAFIGLSTSAHWTPDYTGNIQKGTQKQQNVPTQVGLTGPPADALLAQEQRRFRPEGLSPGPLLHQEE